jgi:hypothetical protein
MLDSTSKSARHPQTQAPPEGLYSKTRLMESAALDRRLSSNTVRVLAVMLFHLPHPLFARQDEIAKWMGASVKTVKRAVRELKAAGFLRVEHRYRTTSIYHFAWRPRRVKSDPSKEVEVSNLTGQTGQICPVRGVKSDPSLLQESYSMKKTPEERARTAPNLLRMFEDLPQETIDSIQAETPYDESRIRALFEDCRQWCEDKGKSFTPWSVRSWCRIELKRDREDAARVAAANGRPRGAVETAIDGLRGFVNGEGTL